MRYLVRGTVKPGREDALLKAVDHETLGEGSVAGGEYLRNMRNARLCDDGTVRWVEVCYCPVPLEEERPYWEDFFTLEKVQDAHARKDCLDENGTQSWACSDCDCTAKLEERMEAWGTAFLPALRDNAAKS